MRFLHRPEPEGAPVIHHELQALVIGRELFFLGVSHLVPDTPAILRQTSRDLRSGIFLRFREVVPQAVACLAQLEQGFRVRWIELQLECLTPVANTPYLGGAQTLGNLVRVVGHSLVGKKEVIDAVLRPR
jgi:hypothetical protein